MHKKLSVRPLELFGVTGAKGAGKDTLAKLINQHTERPFWLTHFADPLKQMTMRVFGTSEAQMYDASSKEAPLSQPIELDRYLVQMEAETGLALQPRGKVAQTPRQLMQFFGTDYVRSVQGDFWIQSFGAALQARLGRSWRGHQSRRVLVPDTRFLNEGEYLASIGGRIIRVERMDWEGTVVEHDSEAHWRAIPADLELKIKTGDLSLSLRVARLIGLNKFKDAQRYDYRNIAPVLEAYKAGEPLDRCSQILGLGAHKDASIVTWLLSYYDVPLRKFSGGVRRAPHQVISGRLSKRCCACGWKPLVEFSLSTQSWDGYTSNCTACVEQERRTRYAKYDALTFRSLFKAQEKGAVARNLTFSLSVADLERQWAAQGGRCFYTGVEMTWQKNDWRRVSVDRRDNAIGYSCANIVLCTVRANMMKRDMSVTEFIEAARLITNHNP